MLLTSCNNKTIKVVSYANNYIVINASTNQILQGNNYNEASFDVEKLQKAVKDISDSPLVKEIMPLLGLE